MSDDTLTVSATSRPRATIPPDEPAHVQELVRRELANLLQLRDKEAEIKERVKRREDLLRMRRRLRDSINTRETELLHDKRELAEIEKELLAIRLPPGLITPSTE